jgi:putative DNA primase/helicase
MINQLPPALDALTELPRWVVWRYEVKEGSDKPTKVPYQALRPNEKAATTKPETWASHAEAVAALERSRTNSRPFDGIGFSVTGSKIAAFDVDNCRDKNTGVIHDKVWELIRRCGTYAEITPSGTGLRIIGHYADDPKQGKKAPMPGANGVSIEVYPASGRYITVTGDHLDGAPDALADITDMINEVIAQLNATPPPPPSSPRSDTRSSLPNSMASLLSVIGSGAYPSRSELLYAFINAALRAGVTDEAIVAACLNDAHGGCGIFEHCRENGGEAYVRRQINHALEENLCNDERLTELGNARRLVKHHGEDLRFVHAWRSWMIWHDGHWRRDEDGGIVRLAKATVEAMLQEAMGINDQDRRTAMLKHAIHSQKATQLRNMVSLAESEPEVVLAAEKWDADPLLLGVMNGVVDLRTCTFRESKKEDHVTKLGGVSFEAQARCPNWDAFLVKIFNNDQEFIKYVQRAVGYMLTGKTVEEVMFILWGDGVNGKSTFRETIFAMLGDYAIGADVSLLITNYRQGGATPDLARLHGRRLVTVNETEEKDQLNESRVKFITSNDVITARGLYEGFFDFMPSHKTVLTTNHKPIVKGTDEGIWRRIHLWPFIVIIPKREKDRDFRVKKLMPELGGILNWALDGLKEYHRIGLEPPPSVVAATNEYREDMDIIGRWLDERCVLDLNARVKSTALYADFKEWGKLEMGWEMSATVFGRNLGRRFKRAKVDRERGFSGLRLYDPRQDRLPM